MRPWRIGTSGFSYPRWRGLFYPPRLPRQEWLAFYQKEFSAVELNVTFYRNPRESTFLGWREATDAGFRFVLKMSRRVSHIKRMADCRDEFTRFWEGAQILQGKLAVVLLQLPPSLAFDPQLFDSFLAALPEGFPPLAWEMRHKSYLYDTALAWLRDRRQSLVVTDSGGRYPTIRAFTAQPAYLRFHGPAGLYSSPYTEEQLASYVRWVYENVPAGSPVYAFFNNDVGGHALTNARQLRTLTEVLDP